MERGYASVTTPQHKRNKASPARIMSFPVGWETETKAVVTGTCLQTVIETLRHNTDQEGTKRSVKRSPIDQCQSVAGNYKPRLPTQVHRSARLWNRALWDVSFAADIRSRWWMGVAGIEAGVIVAAAFLIQSPSGYRCTCLARAPVFELAELDAGIIDQMKQVLFEVGRV